MWNWTRSDTGTIKEYNRIVDDQMLNILDFIQLHYFTKREDTEFWRWCKHEITVTDFNKENLENFKSNFVNQMLLPEDGLMSNFRIYDCLNWIQVMHGLRLFDVSKIKELYDRQYNHKYRAWDEQQQSRVSNTVHSGWIKPREALNLVKDQSTHGVSYTL